MNCFLEANDSGMRKVVELIRGGDCVAVPTETVYGLAADAFNRNAVRRIFSIKGRPLIDPLIVHLAEGGPIEKLVSLNERQYPLMERLSSAFWPGPLTIVAPKNRTVLDIVTANRDSVAIRCPNHPVTQELLKQTGCFLAAPSANPFGYVSPTCAEHVADSLAQRCPYILNGGPCASGIESTIIDIRDPQAPKILRPGPITLSDLESCIGFPIPLSTKQPADDVSRAPGQLARHYSPRTTLRLFEEGQMPSEVDTQSVAKVYLYRPSELGSIKEVYWLSEEGDLIEVARNLFSLLRALDGRPELEVIYCENPKPGGIADAIRDRLIRASNRE